MVRAIAAARAAAGARSLDCRRCGAPQHAPRSVPRLLKMAERLGSLRKSKATSGLSCASTTNSRTSLRPARAIPSSPARSCPATPCRGASITCTIAQVKDIATRHAITPRSFAPLCVGDEKAAVAASDRLMDYVEELTRATRHRPLSERARPNAQDVARPATDAFATLTVDTRPRISILLIYQKRNCPADVARAAPGRRSHDHHHQQAWISEVVRGRRVGCGHDGCRAVLSCARSRSPGGDANRCGARRS